ncbi:ribosome small subunit-dependent GTPase A [Halobacillus salinus]|uniref:Small ribosomal subunit biogenesis GTPase RsgA n=1 Tax=Halobacillus salinus TaxID=192814 RepID=A0A4Z0H3X3_9BACI|nr:ribosome small subunit-dependent GTPase A [Halobacillus salinus]TGB05128.1 ribosome small subunit-dependent GTPase A [Halobacillus salinus]
MNLMNEFFSSQVIKGEQVGRISFSAHGVYSIVTDAGTIEGRIPGRFYHRAEESKDYPAVGDWVVYQRENQGPAIVDRVLNRKTLLSRKKAGPGLDEQVMVANVDVVLVVTSLTKEFNVRRIERYVQQVYESGARPVIVCTKKDLCTQVNQRMYEVERVAPGVPVHCLNTIEGEGVDALVQEWNEYETVVLIGSSGVGKSTLINHLLSEHAQETQEVRAQDHRGRHTTTHRELFRLLDGAFLIDTPGMREMQLWGEESTIDQTFLDIDQLQKQCKFRDCQHETEPGCAVRRAINDGELEEERLNNYRKLKRELKRLALKEKYGTQRTNRMLHGPNKIQ